MTAAIALATCADFPAGDSDEDEVVVALRALGIEASYQVWTDEAVDWDRFAAVVIRSTWDYPLRRTEFLAWAEAVPRLANPAPVLAWNSDKVYLRELSEAGVPIVTTRFFAPGEPVEFPTVEFVVKPSVGAGSKGAGRFRPEAVEAARVHAEALQSAGLTVLVQPYLTEVDTAGETALVYFGGRFSHAIRKGPMLGADVVNPVGPSYEGDLFMREQITGRVPSESELAVGEQVLRAVRHRFGADLLYTRVDLLPGADGPVLIELEATEPSLFLKYEDGATRRLADAIATYLA